MREELKNIESALINCGWVKESKDSECGYTWFKKEFRKKGNDGFTSHQIGLVAALNPDSLSTEEYYGVCDLYINEAFNTKNYPINRAMMVFFDSLLSEAEEELLLAGIPFNPKYCFGVLRQQAKVVANINNIKKHNIINISNEEH